MTNYSAVGRKSKTKGSSYELRVAKIFTTWWGAPFHRVPASGGLHWSASMNVSGDIVTIPEAGFPFVIECKKREEWTLDNVFLNNKDIKNWWAQVVGDADETGKIPMLVFSRNRAEDYVMLPYNEDFLQNYMEELPRASRAHMYIEYLDEHKRPHGYNTITILLKDLVLYSPDDLRADYNGEYNWRDASQVTNRDGAYEKAFAIPEGKVEEHVKDLISKANI